MGSSSALELGQESHDIERFGSRVRRWKMLYAVVTREPVLDRPDQPGQTTRRLKNCVHKRGSSRFPVGASYTRQEKPFVRLSIEVASRGRERWASVLDFNPGTGKFGRAALIAHQRTRPTIHRLLRESAAIHVRSRKREKQEIF